MKRVLFVLLVLSLAASPCWAAGLKLTIHNGRVSLDAQDVTLRQILTEWARVGNTRIVNLERVTSGPMTLKFDDLPESQALDIILRSIPGYMAAPRATMAADASIYDRILIMATTTAVAARPASSAFQSPFQSSSSVTQLRATPPMIPGVLPEPPAGNTNGQGPDMSDPAIAAAAAAGLIAVPAPLPGSIDPALRNPAGPPRVPPRAGAAPPPASSGPTPIWTAPAGTAQPGPPTPAPAPMPTRPGSIAPPQADR